MSPQAELLSWYAQHGRDLPWRHTRDPYRILVSETMLQQTQVERVLGFYQRWLQHFPDTAALAQAVPDTVHRCWQGLGYPNRADRLQAACRIIVGERAGHWPDRPETLQELPGIGPYTAGAVACFAFNQPVPLVDTNIARVYARRDGLPLPLDRRNLWRHASSQVDPTHPIAYHNALMDLGALICTARSPTCPACPWRSRCRSQGQILHLEGTANPLRVASPQRQYATAVPRAGRPLEHRVIALVHHHHTYLAPPSTPVLELPRLDHEDDRTALRRGLHAWGLELLAARTFLTWSEDAGNHVIRRHAYRCKVFQTTPSGPWLSPAEFQALKPPAGLGPCWERLRDYHRIRVDTCDDQGGYTSPPAPLPRSGNI